MKRFFKNHEELLLVALCVLAAVVFCTVIMLAGEIS